MGEIALRQHCFWLAAPAVVHSSLLLIAMMPRGREEWKLWFYGISMPHIWWGRIASVDLMPLWMRHMVWAKGEDALLATVTQRYASTSVLMSLLVSAELGVFFSPSNVVESVRKALSRPNSPTAEDPTGEMYDTMHLEFWTGIALCVSIFFSIAALLANYTAWSIFSSLSKENAPIVLRSSMGLYAAQLPSRLVQLSVYLFFVWVCTYH